MQRQRHRKSSLKWLNVQRNLNWPWQFHSMSHLRHLGGLVCMQTSVLYLWYYASVPASQQSISFYHSKQQCCYGSQNLVSGRFRTDSWKNPRTRTRFRIPNEGIINLYTPAVEHSACPLVGGKCGDDAHLRWSSLRPAQMQRYHRPTRCVPDNNAEAIIILDSHRKGPDTSASRPWQDAAAPFNTALSDLHPDHSTTSSLRRHLMSSTASSLTHATQCT